jgi:purine-binding chemotaxis protein CheW
VPLAPALVSGLLNLRGHIVTAIDLRRCLELRERPAGQQPVNVILRSDGGSVSLLVDRVGDVIEVDDADRSPAPRTLRGRLGELVRGVHKLDGQLLLVFDTDAALAFSAGE